MPDAMDAAITGIKTSHTEIGRLRKLAAQSFTAGGRLDIIFREEQLRIGGRDKNNINLSYLFKCPRFFLCSVGSENR